MRKMILSTALLYCCIAFTSSAQEYNHRNVKILELSEQNDAKIANPENFVTRYSLNNLRLYPIIASETFRETTRDMGKFTLFRSAIESNKMVITETGAQPGEGEQVQASFQDVSGTVNTLFAKNNSNDTIFIMAGEVVKGGKQDRVIGQDVVLVPGQEVNLSAFCIESSRWTTKEGNGGKFTGYYNVSSMDIRKTVTTEKNQSMVWQKVDEHTAANGASSETHTYTNLENSEEYQKSVQEYMEMFKDAFKDDDRVIGVIAVTGDQVMGLDIFATHDLFITSFPNLLHSYAGNAITNGAPVTIGNQEVYYYLDQLLASQEGQNERINDNGSVYEYKNKKLHISYY